MSRKLGFALLVGAVSAGLYVGCGSDDSSTTSSTAQTSTSAGSGGSGAGSGGAASTSSSSSTTMSGSSTSSTMSTSSAGGSAGSGGSAGGTGGSGNPDDGGSTPDASGGAGGTRDGGGDAGPAFDRNAIIDVMKKVAQNQLAEHPPASAPNDWIYGAFYTGLMAAARTTKDPMIHDAARTWAMAHNWDIHTRTPPDPTHADDHCCTQTYSELYLEAPGAMNAFMYQKFQTVVDNMIAAPKAGRDLWWWCDALFMAPPAFARLGAETGQTKYFDFMNTLYWDSKAYLFDSAHSLFFRDKNTFGTTTFWSRGNGWVIAGVARVLDYLPMNDPHRNDFVQLLTSMSTAIVPLQGTDGLWRADLLNPMKFPMGEASGSGFFTFALAWGVHHGVLSRDTYLPVVRKGWNGLLTLVAPDGRMQFVQPTGAAPAASLQSDHLPYGAGAFLLAGSEVAEL